VWLDEINIMKKKSKKTTEQISEESGIPKGTLNKIFSGQTADPKYSTLLTLVHCLGFTIDDLEPKKESIPTLANVFTQAEYEHIKKYRTLDEHGMEVVDTILDLEIKRMNQVQTFAACGGLVEAPAVADDDDLPGDNSSLP
jgi:transcriptional regulator with XRE-family HTH domain